MKRKIDPTLLELWIGIFVYGAIFEIALLLFSRNPAYSIGLWIGVLAAMAGALHMWWSLDRGLDLPQKEAARSISAQNIIRYAALVVLFGIVMCTDFANPIFVFCGSMGMKVSAYLNPFIHRLRAEKDESEISDGTAL